MRHALAKTGGSVSPEIDDAHVVGMALQFGVKPGPALRRHIPTESHFDFMLGAWSQFEGYQILRPRAQPVADIVAGDHQIGPTLIDATHDQMDMRVVSVPVRHGGPVQAGAKIGFHLPHEVAGEAVEVRHLRRVLGRDDEAEMMPVIPATGSKILCIHVLTIRPEQMRFLAVMGDAIPTQIGEMIGQRSRTRAAPGLSDHASLDGDAAMGVEQATSAKPGMPPPEGRGAGARAVTISLSGAVATASACASGGMKHLRQKGSGPGRVSCAPDAAWTDAKILIAGHQNLTVQENPI